MIIAYLIGIPLGIWLGDVVNKTAWPECFEETHVEYSSPKCVEKRRDKTADAVMLGMNTGKTQEIIAPANVTTKDLK